MDSHKVSALERLEIVETGRRRRWSEDEKARIVLESMAGPRLVLPTARRHSISRSMLVVWRRAFKGARSQPSPAPPFVPAIIAVPASRGTGSMSGDSTTGAARIEIVLAHDRRVIVDERVDPVALSRVLDVLERR